MYLTDRDCVILDGSCKCTKPSEDCKYLQHKKLRKVEEDKEQIRRND